MLRLLSIALLLSFTGCATTSKATNHAAPWSARHDSSEDEQQPDRVTQLPGGGIKVAPGGNVTLWRQAAAIAPPFQLSMRVQTTNQVEHPHGAGLVFGGKHIADDQQSYSYFLVRGDGQFLIKTRDGGDTEDICLWTEHAAIRKEDAEHLQASNVLTVVVGPETTQFLVNDVEVHRESNERLHTTGRYGVRLVHDLAVQFDQIILQP
ncbi:MAG: hypothetical protein ACI8UD_003768 [Planctomycetota bacterium]|jgi:hypothetical protein